MKWKLCLPQPSGCDVPLGLWYTFKWNTLGWNTPSTSLTRYCTCYKMFQHPYILSKPSPACCRLSSSKTAGVREHFKFLLVTGCELCMDYLLNWVYNPYSICWRNYTQMSVIHSPLYGPKATSLRWSQIHVFPHSTTLCVWISELAERCTKAHVASELSNYRSD